MTKLRTIALYGYVLTLFVNVCFSSKVAAQPSVSLIMKPKVQSITIGDAAEKILLKARTSGEVEFLWELDGPGAFEGDASTREVLYVPPQAVTSDVTEVTISVTVSDTRGESASDRVTLAIQVPAGYEFLTPTPAAELPPATEVTKADNLYIVIMGAEKYQDKGIQPIQFAARDAQALYNAFIAPEAVGVPEAQVKLLFGSDFTARNIKRTLGKWLLENMAEDDALLLYYTGYQAQEDGEKYWLPFDAEGDDLFSTAISEGDLAEMLERLDIKSVLSFFDTSIFFPDETSGGTAVPNDGTPIESFSIFSEDKRIFIQASDGTEFSTRLAEEQHGEFAALLVQALRGDAVSSEGAGLTSADLLEYLEGQMEKNSETMRSVQGGELERELVLIARKVEEKEIGSGGNTGNSGDEDTVEPPEGEKDRIIEIYRNGDISAEQFKKALDIIKSGEDDQILNDFLEGTISLEIFSEIF